MAKRKKATTKARKPAQKTQNKPVRKSRRQRKLAPECNGLFCNDPGCNHGKKGNKVDKGSKTCPMRQIQKRAITKKQPVKVQNKKPVKCKKKKNRRHHVYNKFFSHVSKRCRDAGIKQTKNFNYMTQAGSCWRALTPQQKKVFECGGNACSPPAPGPAPETPQPAPTQQRATPQPAAPQAPTNPGARLRPGNDNGGPYFLHGNFRF